MAQWKKQLKGASPSAACGLLLLAAGCSMHPAPPTNEQIRRQAAQDAQQMRHDLKDAGKETRRALAEAGRETSAAVAGAREGWKAGAPANGERNRDSRTVDVNHASAAELEALPGMHPATARRIIAGRPYESAAEIRKRGIVSRDEYARISSQIEAE